jgi:formylglycine-generating enzyme required for sulfatase activity
VAWRTRSLPLRGIDNRTDDSRGIVSLYVPLMTDLALPEEAVKRALMEAGRGIPVMYPALDPNAERIPDRDRARSLSALEAICLRRSLVILGEAGAGKSTLLAFLAHVLATGDRTALPGWPETEWSCLPVLLRLRDFSTWLAARDPSEPSTERLVWGFLRHELTDRNLGFCLPALETAIQEGRALLLWDGLDEVHPSGLAQVRASLLEFCREAPQCRFVLTSRVFAYQHLDWRLPAAEFPIAVLQPFGRDQVIRFLTDWFQELGAHGGLLLTEAEALADTLCQEITRAHCSRLASNPLTLTLMALIFTERRELREERARLFEGAVDVLFSRMDRGLHPEDTRIIDLLREARRDRCDAISLCERLSMLMQHQGDGGRSSADPGQGVAAGLGEPELVAAVRLLHPRQDLDWAQALTELIKQRAGLLCEERPAVYDFPHRAIREYLAGCAVAHAPDFAQQVAGLAHERTYWRETILHSVGFLVHSQREVARPLDLIESLCPPDADMGDALWRRVWLAGEVAIAIGYGRAVDTPPGARTFQRVRHRLAALVESGVLHLGERAAAAAVLARLGDPRFEHRGFQLPARYHGEHERALGMVAIKPGLVVLGCSADVVGVLPNEFGGDVPVALDYHFWIGRYPVTVGQFRVFVAARGYERREWWSELGWAWCHGQRRKEPEGWGRQRAETNRPVVGVTWFEAVAYAAWLDTMLRKRRTSLPAGYGLRLPTEAEWALTARGTQGRVYPWGDRFGDGCANCLGLLGEPSAVGLFPLGATPEGVADMGGNVWEWTLSRDQPYPYQVGDGRNDVDAEGARILRGGSFDAGPLRTRTTARARAPTRETARDLGFRLVLSLSDEAV